MQQTNVRPFLFPHSVLPETAARCFLTVWPSLECLRSVEPAHVPQWAAPYCAQRVLTKDETFWARVRGLLKGYRELGSRVGEDGLMAVLSRDWAMDAAPETRGHIQSILRGMSPDPPNPADGLLTEAAVFLELGKELDVRELDLSRNLEDVGRLEEKLFQALGADEEDSAELQKALETSNPPLSPEWGHFGYLLRQRIGFWFRLFSQMTFSGERVVLAALSRDVVEEALDALQTAKERHGDQWDPGETALFTFPRVDSLSPEELTHWLSAVDSLESRQRFRQDLEAFIDEPTRPERRRDLGQSAQEFENALKILWAQWGRDAQGIRGYRFVLTAPRDVTYQDIWWSLDRAGAQTLGPGSVSRDPVVFFHLE